MSTKTIVAIGREFGSGGREIGKKLSLKLGVPFYDKELIAMASEKSGMSEEVLESADERASSSFLYSLNASVIGAMGGYYNMPMTDKLFILQSEIIKQVAKEGSCVIVGRCADYILKEDPALFSIFVHAPMEERIARTKRIYELSDEKAEEMVKKNDKRRASYYSYYSDMAWGRAGNSHMSFDSSILGVEGSVELIEKAIELKNRNR